MHVTGQLLLTALIKCLFFFMLNCFLHICIGFEFEQAHYTVSEGAGSITVCAILNIPPRVREEMTLETDLKLFALNGTRDLLAASIAIGELCI